jgi:flagellar motor switch protein FliN
MAAEMLGMDVAEIKGDEEVRDMLGEMGNIVAGNVKSAFTDAGLMCALSRPSFTSGTDFKIEALNMKNYERFAFRCGENLIFVEMAVKISERGQADTRQGKDIPNALDDDTTQEEAPAPLQETKEAPAPTASDPAIPEQPPVQAEKISPADTPYSKTPEDVDLDLLLDVPLEIKVELGRARIKIQKLQNLTPGSAIKLIKLEGEPVDILVNDTLIARGEVMVQNEKYGIRVTEITSRMDRIRSFGI